MKLTDRIDESVTLYGYVCAVGVLITVMLIKYDLIDDYGIFVVYMFLSFPIFVAYDVIATVVLLIRGKS